MNLQEQIDQELISALKAKDTTVSNVLRMLKTAITNKEKSAGAGDHMITDEDIIKIISKEISQRKEAGKIYQDAGKSDRADIENAEIKVLEKYMPEQISDAELEKIIASAIVETGATSGSDLGKVMGKVMPQIAGKADGNKVSALVRQKLNS